MDTELKALLIMILILFSIVGLCVYASAEARQEFMTECLTENKQYQCTAMWRAGEKNVTYIHAGR